jgi:hypothetical protein
MWCGWSKYLSRTTPVKTLSHLFLTHTTGAILHSRAPMFFSWTRRRIVHHFITKKRVYILLSAKYVVNISSCLYYMGHSLYNGALIGTMRVRFSTCTPFLFILGWDLMRLTCDFGTCAYTLAGAALMGSTVIYSQHGVTRPFFPPYFFCLVLVHTRAHDHDIDLSPSLIDLHIT